jgi:hypothetical protein
MVNTTNYTSDTVEDELFIQMVTHTTVNIYMENVTAKELTGYKLRDSIRRRSS